MPEKKAESPDTRVVLDRTRRAANRRRAPGNRTEKYRGRKCNAHSARQPNWRIPGTCRVRGTPGAARATRSRGVKSGQSRSSTKPRGPRPWLELTYLPPAGIAVYTIRPKLASSIAVELVEDSLL